MLHLGMGEGEREAAALDFPAAPPRPAALTYLLQGPMSLVWNQSCPQPQPWKSLLPLLLPQVSAALYSHWSRLGGFRSWSAITLAEKLYKFNMFWKKESSETSYYGNGGK